MPLELTNINKQKTGFFRFNKLNNEYLITNDVGDFCFLDAFQFDVFIRGYIELTYPDKYTELRKKGFIREELDFEGLAQKYASKNMFLRQGPSLHIIVVTLRCDHKCIYCQTNSQALGVKGVDMDMSTAEHVVDRIFESPNKDITIEFQGGEPLLNWKVIKFIIDYAKNKKKQKKKNLFFCLVTNLTFMTSDRLQYLLKNNVSICSSLDGPEVLHNNNRISMGKGSSYSTTVKRIENIQKKIKKRKKYKYKINALVTITKSSLTYPKEIIDEYVGLGLEAIHLRPVNPFGLHRDVWNRVKFSPEDFFDFYRRALDYVIQLNLEGKFFFERTASVFLTKILTSRDPNFLDLRSPCGAGIGQLAYNFNGDVYTCDEGRMLSRIGDESFKLANVKENSYKDFINSEVTKTICIASCLDSLPQCSQCVFKPYCGVCPIYNYSTSGNIFAVGFNEKCRIHFYILSYLFQKLREKRIEMVFTKWVSFKNKKRG